MALNREDSPMNVQDGTGTNMVLPRASIIRANRLADKLEQLKRKSQSVHEDDDGRQKVYIIVNTRRPVEAIVLLNMLAQYCNVMFAWVDFGHRYWLALSDSSRQGVRHFYIDRHHYMCQIDIDDGEEVDDDGDRDRR